MRNEITFVDPKISTSDWHLFLGPFDKDDGPFQAIESGWSLAHVMHRAGVFPSVKQAKSNGWDKPIPKGFEMFIVGKKKLNVFTMTCFD